MCPWLVRLSLCLAGCVRMVGKGQGYNNKEALSLPEFWGIQMGELVGKVRKKDAIRFDRVGHLPGYGFGFGFRPLGFGFGFGLRAEHVRTKLCNN